jgi:hypothetical protein
VDFPSVNVGFLSQLSHQQQQQQKLCFSFIYCTRYFSCSIAVRRKSILYNFLFLFLSLFMTLQNQIFFEAKGHVSDILGLAFSKIFLDDRNIALCCI